MAKAKKETENLENEDDKELTNEKGEEMPPKVMPKSLSNDPLIAMPKSLESFINKDLLSINAKVNLEVNESLALGTLLISEDFGESFKKCPDEDISSKENIKLGMLKDHALNTGVYAVLIVGEINLKGVHASAVKKSFMQNLIINIKE